MRVRGKGMKSEAAFYEKIEEAIPLSKCLTFNHHEKEGVQMAAKRKGFLSLMLGLTMAFGLLPMGVLAANPNEPSAPQSALTREPRAACSPVARSGRASGLLCFGARGLGALDGKQEISAIVEFVHRPAAALQMEPAVAGEAITPETAASPDLDGLPFMPAGDHVTPSYTITAVAGEGGSFTDVPAGVWYYDAVYDMVEYGLFEGCSPTVFAPQDVLTRAQFATALGRLAEKMGFAVEGCAYEFNDVPSDWWYTKYVQWGAANGVIKGYSATLFGTNDPITREQMAALLARFAEFAKLTLKDGGANKFADAAKISAWAYQDVMKAASAGIMQGSAGLFCAQDNGRRCEAVQAFMNLVRSYIAQ